MQTTPGNDEKGLEIVPENGKLTAKTGAKRRKQRGLRSFIVMLLIVFGIFAVGWVYMGSKSLSQAFAEIVGGKQSAVGGLEGMSEQSAVGGLEGMSEKIKLLESKIANLQSLSETCNAQHKPLAGQNQKLVDENRALVVENKELTGRIDILSKQFDKVNEVYLKRLAAMEKANVTPVVESVAPLVQNPQVVEHEPIVTPQPQDLNAELENENKALIAQNGDFARRNENLTRQLDKVNKVYLTRLAAMEKPIDNTALLAENEELVQMVASLDEQLCLQQELITELKDQNDNFVAENTVSVEDDMLFAEQETVASKPQAHDQDQALADVNAILITQNEELAKKIASLSDQLDKSNIVNHLELIGWQPQNVQRTGLKKQEPAPWKGTSVAELLANVRPAVKNR